MNRKEISEKLNKTYKSMISSDFDSVVHKIKNKKGVLLDMNEKESKSMRGLVVSLLAVCILCVGVLVIDKTKQLIENYKQKAISSIDFIGNNQYKQEIIKIINLL